MSKEDRARLALAVGTKATYLYQIGMGWYKPSVKLQLRLEVETDGRVRAEDFLQEMRANTPKRKRKR
jgi:hypothetical protein